MSNLVNDDSNNSSCSRIYLNQSPSDSCENISLNNNIVPSIPVEKQFHMDKTNKTDFYNCGLIDQNLSDLIPEPRIFYSEEAHAQNFTDNSYDFKNYRYPMDIRVQEKNDLDLDIPQYVDYANIPYESKITLNDSMEVINDIEYRMQCNNISMNTYTNEHYENLHILGN